jgi:glycerol 2-dehydrogenase (NADP+)
VGIDAKFARKRYGCIRSFPEKANLTGTCSGKVKNIGVSNFSVKTLNELLSHSQTHIIPVVNQIEAHPSLPQHELIRFCKERGIVVTAYSPIAKNKLANNETLVVVARRRGVTPAQVLLSWGVRRGTAVIPKTEREDRMKENITVCHLPTITNLFR